MYILSDDFNSDSNLAPIWSFEGPAQGNAAITNVGGDAILELSLPAGDFDIFNNEYNAARVLQDVENTDFGVEASYVSSPTVASQVQGILIEQDADNWIRFDMRFAGGSERLFGAATVDDSTDIKFDFAVATGAAQVLRVTRTDDTWLMEYSADGTTWTTAGTFTHALNVTGVGPFAASTGASPGYTAQLDYFFNTASPILAEDSVPANSAPVGMDDAITVDQDDTVTFTPGSNDTDADGDSILAVKIETQAANGTAVINANGSVTYTPIAGFDGVDSFDVIVADGAGGFDTSTVNVTVAGAPDDPIATDDAYQISPASSSLVVDAAGGVLANDTDPDGDPLNATLLAEPADGTVTLNDDGSFEYTPGAGFSGTDSFTYTVDDGTGRTDTGTVNITQSTSVPYDVTVVSDDFNTSSTLAPIWSLEGPSQGAAAITTLGADAVLEISLPAGDFDIFNNEYNAARVLQDVENTDFGVEASYVSSPTVASQVQGILIEQDADNWIRFDMRFAGGSERLFGAATVDDSTDIKFDFAVATGAAQVLRVTRTDDTWLMEYSADGTTWTTAGTFTHALNVTGVGPFAASTGASPGYTAQLDYFFNTASPILAEDSVPANSAPVGMDDAITVDQDDTVTFTPGSNDTDADGDSILAVKIETQAANGTAVINANGSVTYTPIAGFDGVDSFDVIVADGAGGFDTSTVNVTVAGAPDDPIATDDAYQISPASSSLVVDAAGGVLANDTDPDGDPLNATLLAEPADGTVTLNDDGSFEYTPGAGFSGTDSFTYTVDDGTGRTDTGTVNITQSTSVPYDVTVVSDDFNTSSTLAPIWSLEGPSQGAAAITTLGADAVLEISLPAGDFDIFNNEYNAARVLQDVENTDFGVEASYVSSPTVASQVQGILIEQDADNWIRFDMRFAGGSERLFGAATVDDSTDIKFDFAVATGAAQVLRVTRTDDTWLMEYSADGTTWTTAGTFTHALNVTGVGPFAASTGASPGYTAQLDYFFNTASPILAEDSVPANSAPVGMDDAITVDQDDTVTFTPGSNDTDADGDSILAVKIETQAANGTAVINANGSVTYTPIAGFDGVDSFDVIVADGAGGFDTSTVNVTVAGAPDDPIATDDAYQISPASSSLVVDAAGGVLANDTDPDGDPLNATLLAEPADGTVTLNDDGSFEYTPGAGFSGTDSFTYTVDDGTGRTDTGTVNITQSTSVPYDVTVVSDDFNTSSTLAPIWSLEGPSQGAAAITTLGADAVLEISLPAGDFDIFNNEYNAARVLQDVENTDFGVEASYVSSPTVASQVQGILIEQDADNWIRFDMRFAGGSERLFGAATVDDSTDIKFDFAVATGAAQVLRVTRTDDTWLMEYSADGTTWTTAGTFTHAQNVTGVGPFAASTGASPGYTAQLDYFFNTASPILAEDSVPANSAPVGMDDIVELAQDDSITFQPGQNDTDANANVVAAVGIETEPLNGTAVANADGSVTYTPNPGFDGTDTFEIVLTDGQGGFDTSVVMANVTGTEDDPVAQNDAYLVDPAIGSLTVGAALGVLANDNDPDGDALSATVLLGPNFGSLNLATDGSFTYTPDATFDGVDSFTYTVDDGTGRMDTAMVTIGEEDPQPYLVTGTITFERNVVDSTFAATHAVKAADFDGDGDIDLVSTSETTNTVAWLENDGNFNFTKNVIDSGLGRAYPVSIADIDGDGDIDVLAGGFAADLQIIYENDGSGGFSRSLDIVQDGPHSIFAVDIDSDGDLDLLTSGQDENTVKWYENDGSQNFTEFTIDTDLQRAKTAISHDVDGDGDMDVIGTSNLNDEVVWYENDGNQNWTKTVIDTNADGAYYAIGADIDGDGDQDIAAVSQTDSNVVWYENDGSENFTKIQIEGFAAGARSIAAADIDADGDLDLFAAAREGNYVAFYENDGAGNFTNRVVDANVDGAYGIDIFDINLDGLLDVASAARDTGEISVHTQKRQHEVNVGLDQGLSITSDLLQAVDVNNAPSELIFTITTAPTDGDLILNGVTLVLGDTFTQEDVDLGLLSYDNTGTAAGTDGFEFTLSDGNTESTPISSDFIFNIIDFDVPVYDAPGEMVFDGTASTVLEVPHEQAFEVQEGTIAFAFNPADVDGAQGLYSKDAAGLSGGGNHLIVYLQGNVLKVRAQDGQGSGFLEFSGIEAGTEYEVALTFGSGGVTLWIDGAVVDTDSIGMDWSNGGNVQVTQWGARGWGSASEATGFDAPFNGTISDKQIYGQILDAAQIAALANVSSGENNDPDAVNDAITVAEDGSVTFDPTLNDTDDDNDPVQVDQITAQAISGVAVIEADGSVTYTPDADFNGTDSFEIQVEDGLGGTDTSIVSVTVTPEADDPDAQDDLAMTTEGTAVVISVLENDADVDGDTVSVSTVVSQPANGTALNNNDGTITYTPNASYFGIDSFTYEIQDGTGRNDIATVNVSVSEPGNTAPVAMVDSINVDEDQSINFQPGSNDTDVDGNTVIADSIAVQPGNGSAVVEADGTVTYTPNADYNGSDTFDVTVTDQAGGTDTETVTVTVNPVNDDPVANDDAAVTTPSDPVIIDLLGNDTDIDGDTLNIFNIGTASHGSIVDNSDGTVTYTPTDPNFEGEDTFTYTVSDGTNTDTATVSVDLNAFPDPIVDMPGVMVFDGTTSSVLEVPHSTDFEIEQGTVAFSFNADNTNGQQGLFTKDAAGFAGGGNHLAVYLVDTTLRARFQDGTESVILSESNIQAGEDYEVSLVFGPNGSELYINGELEDSDPLVMDWRQNVEVTQWGGRGWGSDSGATGFSAPFDGIIADKQIYDVALTAAQIAELQGSGAPGNTAPVAVDDILSVLEDTFITFDPSANDTDADGDTVVTTAIAADPSNGTAVLNSDGTVTYTPNAEYSGQDSFFVEVSDGNGGTDTSEVRLTVNGQDDDPVAVDDTASTDLGQAVIINVVANDTDADGDDTLLVASFTQGSFGTVVNNGDGTVTYTPNSPTFEGTDTFTYNVTDGDGFPDEGLVTVEVGEVTPALTPIYTVAGVTEFDGGAADVINVAPTPTLEVAEGTIAFSFIADSELGRQGLITKDASGFVGGGHHFAAYIDRGDLKVRFQDEDSSASFTFAGLQADQEYEFAATFDANGVALYVDGALVGDDDLVMDWTNNQQYMQVGALGWGSADGASNFSKRFAGEFADVEIYDSALDATEVQTLADMSSFDLIM